MTIAPLGHEGVREQREGARRPPLRLVPGGRPAGAPRRGSALHARRGAEGVLAPDQRRSRSAHPTALSSPSRAARVTEDAVVDEPILSYERAMVTWRSLDAEARTQRRAAIRAQTLARRRRTVAVLAATMALVALALPLRALGAVTQSGQAAPGGVPTGLADGSIYVVQPGDTLAGIAAKVNPAAVGTLVHELGATLGTTAVVPGERIRIP